MRERYNTSTFRANKIKNGKPVRNEMIMYCSYCCEEAQRDYTVEDRDRVDYVFCNCERAELEIEYRKKMIDLKRKMI